MPDEKEVAALARDAKLRAAVRQYVKQNCTYIPESYPSVCRHLTDCETCNRRNFAKLLEEEPPRKALEFGEERGEKLTEEEESLKETIDQIFSTSLGQFTLELWRRYKESSD